MKVGIIGAGSIAVSHINAYKENKDVELVMIADVNEAFAKSRAEAFGIPKYCTDYKEMLADDTIEAVSVATPTFTHCQIVCDALAAGKHVLCEKPPALTVEEAEKCAEAAKKSGKLLMYGLVRRFSLGAQYLREFNEAGGFGKILTAEASRVNRCSGINGWFVDKTKSGGGMLMDAAIHEVDLAMYLMGYPNPKSILGYTSYVNNDLPKKVKGMGAGWRSLDKTYVERSVEAIANGFVTFDNGACLTVRSGQVQLTVKAGVALEISGEKAGAKWEGFQSDITMLKLDDNDYMNEFKPTLDQKVNSFQRQIDHFVDCCVNGTPCIVTPEQGITLLKVIRGLYDSAESGKPITF